MKDFIDKALRTESTVFNPMNERILHAVMGIASEAGELIDPVKAAMFYGKELDTVNILEESSDILWFLAILFDELGTTFEEQMSININKLKARYPDKFEKGLAINRDKEKERECLESGVKHA